MDRSYAYDMAGEGRGQLIDAWRDIAAGARMWRIWGLLGWRDFRNQTKRTLLGPLWSVIGLAITVGALGFVYGALLSWPPEKGYPYIAAGFIAWFFISGCLLGGLTVYTNASGILQERALPISFSVYRYTWRLFIEFCVKFLVFALVAVLIWFNPGLNLLYVLPGLVLFFATGLWVNLMLGVIGARARDVEQLVMPLMLIAFLATPILWPKDALGKKQFISDYNPLVYFIDVIREPLLGSPPSAQAVLVVLSFILVGWIAAFLLFARFKSRLVFWL